MSCLHGDRKVTIVITSIVMSFKRCASPHHCVHTVSAEGAQRLGVFAELPDGTGEVARPCDEVAPSGIQGHAHYHSYSNR